MLASPCPGHCIPALGVLGRLCSQTTPPLRKSAQLAGHTGALAAGCAGQAVSLEAHEAHVPFPLLPTRAPLRALQEHHIRETESSQSLSLSHPWLSGKDPALWVIKPRARVPLSSL